MPFVTSRSATRIGPAPAIRVMLAALLLCWGALPAAAAASWTLDPAASVLTYQSIKKNTIVETNKIRNITGVIDADGKARVTFDLNSVDTGVDLRNVRMRFLFFETFKFPVATVTATLDPATFAELPTKRRMVVPLSYTLNLHGVDKQMTAEVAVTMITDGMVSVTSQSPIAVNVDDFGLLPNVEKLQQAANVSSIVPTASVSFDFVYRADGQAPVAAPVTAAAEPEASVVAAAAPAEAGPVATDASKTTYSVEECMNRFEVLGRTGSIYFRSASARLDFASKPVLDAVLDVVSKCPELKVEVAGYTDSDGDDAANQRLSERRAQTVATYIIDHGIAAAQLTAKGYGEAQPIAANDTPKNKALNRRIEFSAMPIAN